MGRDFVLLVLHLRICYQGRIGKRWGSTTHDITLRAGSTNSKRSVIVRQLNVYKMGGNFEQLWQGNLQFWLMVT